MGKIARAGIAFAAIAGLAGGVWLALRPRPPVPSANDAKPAAPSPAAARPTAAKPIAVPDDSPTLRVLDRDTGAPIDGAWVEFVPETETDDDIETADATRIRAGTDGFVRIPLAVLESKDWLNARIGAPDHLAIELDRVIFCALFLARAPSAIESAAPISFSLPHGVERAGRVIDEDGRAIEGVRASAGGYVDFSLRELHPTIAVRQVNWSFESQSDEEGRFSVRLAGDSGQTFFARLEKKGYLLCHLQPTFDYDLLMSVLEVELVTLYAEARIKGRMMDPSGSPIEGAWIVVRPEAPERNLADSAAQFPGSDSDTSAADGSFTLRLGARFRHTIEAKRDGYRATEIREYLPEEGRRLEIALDPLSRASVRLFAGDPPAPVRGAVVYVFFPIYQRSFREPSPQASDAEGRIRFTFPPGEKGREIVVLAPEAGFGKLEVPAFEDCDQDLGDLVLRPRHTLDVTLSDSGGSPAAGIELGLELEVGDEEFLRGFEFSRSPAFGRLGRTDASGRIAFLHLPAGTYSITPPDGRQLTDERGVRPEKVRVPSDSPLVLSVLPMARILGSVIGPGGVPVPKAMVYVHLPEADDVASGDTDERGRFVLSVSGVREGFQQRESIEDGGPVLGITHDGFVWREIPLPRVPEFGETIDLGPIELDQGGCLVIELPASLALSTSESWWKLFGADGEGVPVNRDPGMPRDRVTEEGLRIELLPAASYRLRLRLPGYRPWESQLFALASDETREIVPPLEPVPQLAGTVVDAETGEPVKWAEVTLGRSDEWKLQLDGAKSQTDEEGRFLLDMLEARPQILSVWAQGFDQVSLWVDSAQGSIEPIRLFRQTDRKTDKRSSVRLLLVIRRPNGLLLPRICGGTIEVAEPRRYSQCSHDDSEDCHIANVAVSPPFRFRVWVEGFLPSEWIDVTDVGATRIGPLAVALRDGPPIRVAVRWGDGTPVARAHVSIDIPSFMISWGHARWDGDTDAGGEVALCPLPSGPIWLSIEGEGLPRTEKLWDYDGRGGPIPIVVGRAAALACTLRFPAPRASLEIVLGAIYKDSVHDVSSPHSLRIGGIPPGTHELEILSADTGLAYMSRELAFAEGEPLTAEFDLPMGSIEGRLAAGGRVMVRPVTSSDGNWLFADADPSGGFSITALPPGTYRVAFAGRAGIPAGQEIEVRDGETTHVEMKDRSWTLRGSIVAADRSPVRGAQVGLEDEDPFASLQSYDILASGLFAFFEVGEGKQTLIVTAPGFIPFRQSLIMDRNRTIAVILEKGVPISVSVVEPDATHVAARVSWIAADGSSGYIGLVGTRSETWIPPSAVSLRFETESGATIDVPLVKVEAGGFAPVRAVIPGGGED